MDISKLTEGEGLTSHIGDTEVAVYKESGKLTVLENLCTHLRCNLEWNSAEKTWDCPCHGSRFAADGSVIKGPAKRPLRTLDYRVQNGKLELV